MPLPDLDRRVRDDERRTPSRPRHDLDRRLTDDDELWLTR